MSGKYVEEIAQNNGTSTVSTYCITRPRCINKQTGNPGSGCNQHSFVSAIVWECQDFVMYSWLARGTVEARSCFTCLVNKLHDCSPSLDLINPLVYSPHSSAQTISTLRLHANVDSPYKTGVLAPTAPTKINNLCCDHTFKALHRKHKRRQQ